MEYRILAPLDSGAGITQVPNSLSSPQTVWINRMENRTPDPTGARRMKMDNCAHTPLSKQSRRMRIKAKN